MNYIEEMYRDGYLAHYGRGHEDGGHSGRYPWGSHNNVTNRVRNFASTHGERAYRTDDGKLTDKGTARYEQDIRDNNAKKKR